jgi:hypothetical protein
MGAGRFISPYSSLHDREMQQFLTGTMQGLESKKADENRIY